jgi:aerobic-type carbon monoxide dehydrogenase small subunit (CoxS/CutS family)
VAELLELIVDGQSLSATIEPDRTLLRVLREDLGRTGTKEGCDDSECGACMVLIDGRPVNSCSYLALQAAGRTITTVEGLAGADALHPLQRAFIEGGGIQCGFCTPGMLISAAALLAEDTNPSDEAIRDALAGNLCRCTGYQPIIRAVQRAAAELREASPTSAVAPVRS